jgi:hypothetical protein
MWGLGRVPPRPFPADGVTRASHPVVPAAVDGHLPDLRRPARRAPLRVVRRRLRRSRRRHPLAGRPRPVRPLPHPQRPRPPPPPRPGPDLDPGSRGPGPVAPRARAHPDPGRSVITPPRPLLRRQPAAVSGPAVTPRRSHRPGARPPEPSPRCRHPGPVPRCKRARPGRGGSVVTPPRPLLRREPAAVSGSAVTPRRSHRPGARPLEPGPRCRDPGPVPRCKRARPGRGGSVVTPPRSLQRAALVSLR